MTIVKKARGEIRNFCKFKADLISYQLSENQKILFIFFQQSISCPSTLLSCLPIFISSQKRYFLFFNFFFNFLLLLWKTLLWTWKNEVGKAENRAEKVGNDLEENRFFQQKANRKTQMEAKIDVSKDVYFQFCKDQWTWIVWTSRILQSHSLTCFPFQFSDFLVFRWMNLPYLLLIVIFLHIVFVDGFLIKMA